MPDLLNAIETRRSRRKYLPTALEPIAADTLQAFISEFNAKEDVKMRLVLNNGNAFNGLRKSYGMFSGVQNYVALIGNKDDVIGVEKLGYYGEWLVLHATSLGLGTCWVMGTFDRASCPVEQDEKESVVCVIVVGNVEHELSVREKLIRSLTHRKTKTIPQMVETDGYDAWWFSDGMSAVQKAPSAVNRQPVTFTFHNSVVTASVKEMKDAGFALDLGIAKLHFELGAGGGVWDWGNGAEFKRNNDR